MGRLVGEMKPIVVVTLVLSLLVLIVLVQNLSGAGVGLLFWDVRLPLSLLLVAFYALGAFTARPLFRFVRNLRYR
jgi:uncharacterized integral membrane protein